MTAEDSFLSKISNSSLRNECQSLITTYPPAEKVLSNLVNHFLSQRPEPASKKRKLIEIDDSSALSATINELSFSTPRKKLSLLCYKGSHFELLSEYSVPFSSVIASILLPTPNKQQKSCTLVVMSSIQSHNFVASFPETPLLNVTPGMPSAIKTNSEYVKHLFSQILNIPLTTPDPNDFKSLYPSTHGIGKVAKSVEQLYSSCYFKAKDGFLYFLPLGIFFGLKKPSFLLSRSNIMAASIDGLTTRSFNLKVTYKPMAGDHEIQTLFKKLSADGCVDIEFDMIDNCEFDAIMQYLNKYKLTRVKIGGIDVESGDPGEEDNGTADQLFHSDSYNEEEDEDYEEGKSSEVSDEGETSTESEDGLESGCETGETISGVDEEDLEFAD